MSQILDMVEIETIEKLADIINKKELSELTIADGERTITIKGKRPVPPPPAAMPFMGMPAQAPAAPEDTLAESEANAAAEISGNIVKAPIVGTFYAAPAADAQPFVKIGDRVKKGQVLAIVEAMKMMNEIESDCDGTISEILATNGSPVEYGQPLFRIN